MATFTAGNGAKEDSGADATIAVALDIGTGTKRLVVGVVKWEGASSSLSSVSNGTTTATLDPLGSLNHSNNDLNGCMFYWLDSAESGSLTFTATLSGNRAFKQIAVGAFNYSGTATRNTGVQTASTGNTVASGLYSPSGSELVVIGFWGNYTTQTPIDHMINSVVEDGIFGNTDGTQGWYRLLSSGFTNGQATCDQQTSIDYLGFGVAFAITAGGGGRTTKNTRAFPLGTELGMNWRVPH